jgi:hypothetical protein
MVVGLVGESSGLVGAEDETAGVADRDAERGTDVRIEAAGVSRETFDAALAAGRIAVAAERITDPATPAPPPTAVAIMLDAGETARGVVLGC